MVREIRKWQCSINAALNIKKFALLKQNYSGSGRPGELQSANTSALAE